MDRTAIISIIQVIPYATVGFKGESKLSDRKHSSDFILKKYNVKKGWV